MAGVGHSPRRSGVIRRSPASSCNEATTNATDPISKQPVLKCCAVRVDVPRPSPVESRATGAFLAEASAIP